MFWVSSKLTVIRNRFKVFYNNELKKRYAVLETKRKKYLAIFWQRFILFSLIGILMAFIGYTSRSPFLFFPVVVVLIIFVVFVYIGVFIEMCSGPGQEYKRETKFLVMDKILEFWGYLRYSDSLKHPIKDSMIEKSKLFPMFNHQKYDDCFEGVYNNAFISVSEQKLYRYFEQALLFKEREIFKGVFIAVEFDKSFKGKIVARSNRYGFSYWRWREYLCASGMLLGLGYMSFLFFFSIKGADAFSSARTASQLIVQCLEGIILYICELYAFLMFFKRPLKEKIELESIDFSKHWEVYSDNQVEARYILNPTLMERIEDMRKLFRGQSVDFSFFDNKLLIAVHTKHDMFETTSLFHSALSYRKVESVICQLYSIFSIIDVLKLDHPVGGRKVLTDK